MANTKYIDSLKDIVENFKPFNIKFFVMNNDIEQNIEAALNTIFEHLGRIELSGVIYTCVKELLINGTKANLNRILFEEKNLKIDDEEEYIKGMMEFRNFLNEDSYQKYLKNLKSRDFWVNIKFNYNEDGVRIEVINNAHITPIEDKRLREKLKKAMGYDSIVDFYMDQGDEIEGAGMGIALIVILLKGLDIDPSLFRIGNTPEKQTFARIEVPITPNFVSLRDKKKKESLSSTTGQIPL